MKTLQKFFYLIILTIVLSSALCGEEDNLPPSLPEKEIPFILSSLDDPPIRLASFFIKINPSESISHDYTVSLDLSKIYEEGTLKAYQLNVGDRLTVKIDFEAYPNSNFMQVVNYYGYTPVFVNRELPGSGLWRIRWSQNHPGTWGIFGHLENHGWSDWWNGKTLLKIVDCSEQAPAYVTYEAIVSGEVGCYYSHQMDGKRTNYAPSPQK